MAATPGSADPSLEERLLEHGHDFSFFQAMRLLLMLAQRMRDGGDASKVRVRPELSLAFPPADVAGIEKTAYGYLLKVTFLGLYGQSSPLPTFYTEELFDDWASDRSAARDLLDVVNHHIASLFHDSIPKYWLCHQVAQGREEYLELLFCLSGLGGRNFRRGLSDPQALLRHAELLTRHPRSAFGLERFLSDALEVPVKVIQCRKRRVPIPTDQRLQLGATNCGLGVDALVGDEVADLSGMFRLQLGPVDLETFSAYLPGSPGRRKLDSLIGCYLTTPLAWDLELTLVGSEAPATTLGVAMGGRLGWDSWLAPDGAKAEASVVFPEEDLPLQVSGHARLTIMAAV